MKRQWTPLDVAAKDNNNAWDDDDDYGGDALLLCPRSDGHAHLALTAARRGPAHLVPAPDPRAATARLGA